jgi:hypothetical protein
MEIKNNTEKLQDILEKINNVDVSISRQSEIIEDLASAVQSLPTTGKENWYDLFWDTFQNNGNRNSYGGAFNRQDSSKYNSNNWNDDIFDPKYDFILKYCAMMFQYSGITSLAAKLRSKGLKFDTSQCDSFLQMFQGANVKDVPYLDGSNCTSLSYTFGTNSKVETIDGLKLTNKLTTVGNAFGGASKLTHCLFEGELAITGLDLHWSTLLDKESITSLINILSTETSGLTVTLSLTAVNNAFEGGKDGEEW